MWVAYLNNIVNSLSFQKLSKSIKFNSQVMCMTLAAMVTQQIRLKLEVVGIHLHACDYNVLAIHKHSNWQKACS